MNGTPQTKLSFRAIVETQDGRWLSTLEAINDPAAQLAILAGDITAAERRELRAYFQRGQTRADAVSYSYSWGTPDGEMPTLGGTPKS